MDADAEQQLLDDGTENCVSRKLIYALGKADALFRRWKEAGLPGGGSKSDSFPVRRGGGTQRLAGEGRGVRRRCSGTVKLGS